MSEPATTAPWLPSDDGDVAFVVALVLLGKPRPAEVALGFAIAALGEAVRFWAAGHLLKTKELITSGPYRYTRNPLYLGRFLILTGLCVMCRLPYYANWILLFGGYAVFFFYYMPRKERVEPARLRAVHGEAYDRYFNAVPALFPTFDLRRASNPAGVGPHDPQPRVVDGWDRLITLSCSGDAEMPVVLGLPARQGCTVDRPAPHASGERGARRRSPAARFLSPLNQQDDSAGPAPRREASGLCGP